MNDDGALDDRARASDGIVVQRGHLVVVDDGVSGLVPDLDSEAVDPAAAGDRTVDRRQDEPIVTRSVDRTVALELGPGARDDKGGR